MRKHQKRVLAILVVMGVAFSGIAFAEQTGNTDPPAFGFPHYGGNEAASAEFSGFGLPPVAENQNGNPDAPAFGFPPPFDGDNNGLVSMDEFPGPDSHFNALDLNSDGYISQDEAPERPPAGSCPMPGDQARGGGFPGSGPPPSFDIDNNGMISMDEFPGPDSHFNALDLNSDGYISRDEAPERPPAGSCPMPGS